MSNKAEELSDGTEPQKAEKPRGACAGCRFDYQLGTARSGEHKGELVIRKHNSRTGPGLCEGAAKPPRAQETEDVPGDVVAVAPGGIPVFSDPAPVPAVDTENGEGEPDGRRGPWFSAGYDAECDGCDGAIFGGDQIRADGSGGWLCERCGADEPANPPMVLDAPDALLNPEYVKYFQEQQPVSAGIKALADVTALRQERDRMMTPVAPPVTQDPHHGEATAALPAIAADDMVAEVAHERNMRDLAVAPDQFAPPAPVAAEMPSVSQQPDPDRDRWGRYLIHKQPHTRATTFAKAASSTFTLNQWQQRMTIAGMALRPDLLALAHGLDVKRDRATLNSIAEQAKEAAGQKVAANLGTAYHAFSERLDAGLISLADVPTEYRYRLDEYLRAVNGAGLRTRPEWIERTVAVRADQVSAELPVAGTLDRIFQLPNGELVIGDLKTGADLSYGWGEIAVQLALYAHGVNTHGLFDWRTKTWERYAGVSSALGADHLKVRTDFAIVMHLPAGGDGCTLYRVDLIEGWKRAQVCGQVMAMQKAKPEALATPFTPEPMTVPEAQRIVDQAFPAPVSAVVLSAGHEGPPPWEHAKSVFASATGKEHLAQLYQYALDSGKFHTDQLATLVGIGKDRLNQLARSN